jgi:hypothetical protein
MCLLVTMRRGIPAPSLNDFELLSGSLCHNILRLIGRLYYMTHNGSVTKRLEGKIAVITGGNSGIGLAVHLCRNDNVFLTGYQSMCLW